jgi:hypothetical protein
MGNFRNVYKILIGKSQGNKPLGIHRHRLEGIKMDLKKKNRVSTGLIRLMIGTRSMNVRSIRADDFLEQLSNYYPLWPPPWSKVASYLIKKISQIRKPKCNSLYMSSRFKVYQRDVKHS